MSATVNICPDNCIGWTEERLELKADWTWHLARAGAAEAMAATLRKEAGADYAEGFDDAAKQKRSHAEWMEAWAKNENELAQRKRKEYEAEYSD